MFRTLNKVSNKANWNANIQRAYAKNYPWVFNKYKAISFAFWKIVQADQKGIVGSVENDATVLHSRYLSSRKNSEQILD